MARMNRPAPVEITYKNMRFLITHNPTNATLNKFIEVSFFLHLWLHIIEQEHKDIVLGIIFKMTVIT